MDLPQCKHIRIRRILDGTVDVETFVKYLENRYKIDIRSIPQWEDLIKSLYNGKHELKHKLEAALKRKKSIIEKLYIQNYRDSPFVLTDKLARTAKVWKEIDSSKNKKRTIQIEILSESIISLKHKEYESEESLDEESDIIRSTAHPNTEVVEARDNVKDKLTDVELETQSEISTKLPVIICTNPHKLLSPLRSQCTPLTYNSPKSSSVTVKDYAEEKIYTQTKAIRSYPEEINMYYNSMQFNNEQFIKFTLRNCTNDWAFVRFVSLSNKHLLKNIKLRPLTPVKLYAGLSNVYSLRFKFKPNVKEFEGFLNFKICRDSLDSPEEILNIQITCECKENRAVHVSECVYLPAVYLWQLTKDRYPSGNIVARSEDDYFYHIHVRKQEINWELLLDVKSTSSLEVQAPATESELQRNYELKSQNTFCTLTNFAEIPKEESISSHDIAYGILLELVENSLKPFLLEPTYFYLKPRSSQKIRVNFTKAEYIGLHQSYYDLEFFNPIDNDLIMTKTVKVFAEILPHPIEIHPIILDMSGIPKKLGLFIDHFTIFNNHKFVPVTIKIELTSKMNRIFDITPQETFITAQSNASFEVALCSQSRSNKHEDLVHFTIKIIVIGDKAVYKNVPPFFYEIIIPCASEFKRVYGKKYLKSASDSLDYDDRTGTSTEVEPSRLL
ncbi:unnamed protein product [Pieris macdunnoughi]|uniref:Uncharacterized protein n=1 Tax=Pieris macdunnoughi TaxID=345717 RepID=A0A821PNM1_9NEOP|nr:unnamed protein product [Pieris macdunnoughi]